MDMEPKIAAMPEMILVGTVCYGGGDICGLWTRFMADEDAIENKIEGAGWEYHVYAKPGESWEPCYMAAARVSEIGNVPDGMFIKVLPAGQWAVFTHCLGSGGYDVLNKGIMDWLAASPYKQINACSLQRYDARYRGPNDPESVLELMIRVVPIARQP
jgi:predicted transcriptional regulator YdeE